MGYDNFGVQFENPLVIDTYLAGVLMRQAQADLADIVEELLKDDGDDDDDIVDIHSISETVSVLAEEDVEDDNDCK